MPTTMKPAKKRGRRTGKTRVHTPVPVRFGRDEQGFVKLLEARASAEDRSLSGQLKHYARLGMIAADNPDLPLSLIEDVLIAKEESRAGLGKPYQFGVIE